MKPYHLLILWTTLLFFTACGSTPTTEVDLTSTGEAPYSEAHLPFTKWNRSSNCCSANGRSIAIASGGTFSSRAGLEVFNDGGNAVDAAVATAFAMAVERPHSLGLGGGGFMTLHLADGSDFFIDFRETAPRKAFEKMFLDKEGKVVPDLSTKGILAAGTPGFVAGLVDIQKKWGTVPLRKVLEPAIRLARIGFPVYPSLAEKIEKMREDLSKDPGAKTVLFSKQGEPLKEGERLIQTDLANTIEAIAKQGKNVFYTGAIGKKIAAFSKQKKGLLDAEDLKTYAPKFREPVRGSFRNYAIVTAPPPSAGGIFMIQMLNVLSALPIEKQAASMDGYVHTLTEVMKHAYADRSIYAGDPDFYKTDLKFLTSPEYANKLRQKIQVDKARPSKDIRPGTDSIVDQKGTSHLSLIDSGGNAVSCTLTINGPFGAGMVVPGTGIFLNNEMDDFSVKPGEPNAYGLTGNEANAVAAKKRPVSSMTPTIVLENGKPVMAVGGAGGSRIISSVIETVLNTLVVYPGDVKKAVFAPRMHHQWLPDKLDLEAGYQEKVVQALKNKGHEIGTWPFSAQVQAVYKNPEGKITAVFDPRDEGGVAAQ